MLLVVNKQTDMWTSLDAFEAKIVLHNVWDK